MENDRDRFEFDIRNENVDGCDSEEIHNGLRPRRVKETGVTNKYRSCAMNCDRYVWRPLVHASRSADSITNFEYAKCSNTYQGLRFLTGVETPCSNNCNKATTQ